MGTSSHLSSRPTFALIISGRKASMDDLLFPKKDSMKPPILVTSCWGCGVEQGDGERFKQCPKCVEYKLVPAKFCSNQCFHSSWRRHKVWHTEQARTIIQSANLQGPSESALQSLAERSEYDSCLAQASRAMSNADLISARTILQKAIKLDPTRPEAYHNLATCAMASGHRIQTAFYFERSIERWALVALTGVIGGREIEKERHPFWAMEQWSSTIDFLTRDLVSEEMKEQKKPEWFQNDGLLKLVTAIALKSCDSEYSVKKKARLSLLRAFAINGIIKDGNFQTNAPIPPDLSSDELLDAAGCFRFVVATARAGNDLGLRDEDIDAYNAHIRVCTNLATLKMTEEVNKMSMSRESKRQSVPAVGSWVVCRAAKHKALPNVHFENSFGQVIGSLNTDGMIPVKVQGATADTTVMLSPVNLVQSPQNEQSNALVACLERETQWKFMASIFEGLVEQGLL